MLLCVVIEIADVIVIVIVIADASSVEPYAYLHHALHSLSTCYYVLCITHIHTNIPNVT